MYQSIRSLTIPPGDPGDSSCPGVGFSLLCLALGGVLNQNKNSTILNKHEFCFVTKTNEQQLFSYVYIS